VSSRGILLLSRPRHLIPAGFGLLIGMEPARGRDKIAASVAAGGARCEQQGKGDFAEIQASCRGIPTLRHEPTPQRSTLPQVMAT
jgi:hypothetical protein